MNERAQRHLVVVPADPGAIVQLGDIASDRDEIDLVLDDMFGLPDDDGPGAADAALLGGGAVAVVASQLVVVPAAVLVAGIAAVGLGAILPLRSLYRRFGRTSQQRRLDKLIGNGILLDTQHAAVQQLVDGHVLVRQRAEQQLAAVAMRSKSVAHTLVHEVASLLRGHELSGGSEVDYVAARVVAINDLAEALANPSGDGPSKADVAARLEVEAVAGTSGLSDASELTNDLLADRDI